MLWSLVFVRPMDCSNPTDRAPWIRRRLSGKPHSMRRRREAARASYAVSPTASWGQKGVVVVSAHPESPHKPAASNDALGAVTRVFLRPPSSARANPRSFVFQWCWPCCTATAKALVVVERKTWVAVHTWQLVNIKRYTRLKLTTTVASFASSSAAPSQTAGNRGLACMDARLREFSVPSLC